MTIRDQLIRAKGHFVVVMLIGTAMSGMGAIFQAKWLVIAGAAVIGPAYL
jgi:hypothetical protein